MQEFNLYDSNLEALAKWLSCNGEVWGVGPTAVFASAAALFLYNELEGAIFVTGDHAPVSLLEKTLLSTMVLGMLALMIHLWVCSMRFFQYYLDTLIKDSSNMLLEMTTVGLLGAQSEIVPLGPLTRFLRQQQPQIHITVCWFLSLCYADYIRKHYCQRFNIPYLEQWQAELHERASCGFHRTMEKINSFVGSVHRRMRGYSQPQPNSDAYTVRAHRLRMRHRWMSAGPQARCQGEMPCAPPATQCLAGDKTQGSACDSSVSQAKQRLMQLRSSKPISPQQGASVAVHRTPASVVLAVQHLRRLTSLEDLPWRNMAVL
ncbi:uncharacterized protein LOC113519919 isoform X1 [Galleria mellonella]|uniref:Uncharacterized protein LOC113519919 isoform X1 n=1 Tax=Galleria mellonella TaxID=7137 RepID=A0ABM3N410_GALME|nr:uncharacterized protein LOC113519919 isoform X1 [Galleria mellonella]